MQIVVLRLLAERIVAPDDVEKATISPTERNFMTEHQRDEAHVHEHEHGDQDGPQHLHAHVHQSGLETEHVHAHA